MGENICSIYNRLTSPIFKKSSEITIFIKSIEKWPNNRNKPITEQEIQMTNIHIKDAQCYS